MAEQFICDLGALLSATTIDVTILSSTIDVELDCHGAGSADDDALLLEDGSYLLLEDGGKIPLE